MSPSPAINPRRSVPLAGSGEAHPMSGRMRCRPAAGAGSRPRARAMTKPFSAMSSVVHSSFRSRLRGSTSSAGVAMNHDRAPASCRAIRAAMVALRVASAQRSRRRVAFSRVIAMKYRLMTPIRAARPPCFASSSPPAPGRADLARGEVIDDRRLGRVISVDVAGARRGLAGDVLQSTRSVTLLGQGAARDPDALPSAAPARCRHADAAFL